MALRITFVPLLFPWHAARPAVRGQAFYGQAVRQDVLLRPHEHQGAGRVHLGKYPVRLSDDTILYVPYKYKYLLFFCRDVMLSGWDGHHIITTAQVYYNQVTFVADVTFRKVCPPCSCHTGVVLRSSFGLVSVERVLNGTATA